MKSILVCLFFIFLNIGVLYANRLVDCPAIVITKQNDTIKTSIIIKLFSSIIGPKEEWVSGSYFANRIYFLGTADKKFIKTKEVKYLAFELDGNKIVFVSGEQVPELNLKNQFCQKMQVGKLNWYKTYRWDSYNATEDQTDYFFLTGQKALRTGLFTTFKMALKKVTESRPDLIPIIDEIKGFWLMNANRGIQKVVTAFNEDKVPSN
jgi:hypothetical protein